MKLVIDIPDYDYKQIKEVYEKSDIVESTYSYIYHGQPLSEELAEILDKISAEIKRMEYHMIDCDVLVSQDEVLDIIEKYKTESEGK